MIDYHTLPKERQEELFREWLTLAAGMRVVLKEENDGGWYCFITEIGDPFTWVNRVQDVSGDGETLVDVIEVSEYNGRLVSLPARGLGPAGWPELAFMEVTQDVQCEDDLDVHRDAEYSHYEEWLVAAHQTTCFPMLYHEEDVTDEQLEKLRPKLEEELSK